MSDAGSKEWLGVDLDGTLAEHYTGEYDPTVIGKPVPRMVSRVKRWLDQGEDVRIFTARADDPEALVPITDWCKEHIGKVLPITNVKDRYCTRIYDDRARQVQENTGEFVDAKLNDDDAEFSVERTPTPEAKFVGMSKYKTPPDHGMLFEGCRSLCMRNMQFPLSALFLDPQHTVVDIQIMIDDDPSGLRKVYTSRDKRASDVLELSVPLHELLNVSVGDRLEIG